MVIYAKIKKLFLRTPFSWPVIAFNAIKNHENNRIRKGSNAYTQSVRNQAWFNDDFDNSRRYNYDLNENSIVFDAGGYKGEYASLISNKYNCHVFIFEPIPAFFKIIQDRFSNNNKIHPYCFGLSDNTSKQSIAVIDNASSVYVKELNPLEIQMKNIIEFLVENNIEMIDLIKLNIEGGEYDLLECLIKNNRVSSFKNILVQFHDFIIPGAKNRMNEIQKELSKTHELTFSYEFVWENWQIK